MDCAACHIAFPELTPFGREFKLNGYTLGERQWVPLAAMMQFSVTNIAKNHDNTGAKLMPHDDVPVFQATKKLNNNYQRKIPTRTIMNYPALLARGNSS